MYQFLQVFCSLFSGIMLALAIPNELIKLGTPVIGVFALVPFYRAIASAKDSKHAFFCGWTQAFTTHILSSFWLGNFRGFALFTLGASAIGTGTVCAFASLLFFAPILYRTQTHILQEQAGLHHFSVPLRILWFAGTYTIWEWAKSFGFLAYPWGTLSMTAYTWPLVTQIADITGPYGVTFLFSLVSALVSEGLLLLPRHAYASGWKNLHDSWFVCVKLTAVLFICTILYGAYHYALPRHPIKTLHAVLVQQDLDPWEDNDYEAIAISEALSEEKIAEFTKENLQCDVVVWSEAVLARYFPNAQFSYRYVPVERPLIPFIKEMGVPFIIGAPLTINKEQHQYGNAAVLLNTDGEYRGAYVKMHLVPFAERIPFTEYAFARKLIKKIAGFSYGWTQGNQSVLFEIPLSTKPHYPADSTQIVSLTKDDTSSQSATVLVSTPICFDDAFSEVCRKLYLSGSEVFINLTNDAWSQTESAEWQHFVVASYRAIEYRTTLARATNAGVTTVVGPTGRMLQTLPLFEKGALAAKIPVYPHTLTVYARFGDWFVGTLFLLAALYLISHCPLKKSRKSALLKGRGL